MSCSCSYHVPEKAHSSAPSMFQVVDQSAQISLPSTPLQVVMSSCHHEDAQASPADSFNVNERANKQVRILTLRAIQTFIYFIFMDHNFIIFPKESEAISFSMRVQCADTSVISASSEQRTDIATTGPEHTSAEV